MRIIVHDNKTKQTRVNCSTAAGNPPPFGGSNVAARTGCARSGEAAPSFTFVGLSLEKGFRERRIGRSESQKAPRRQATVECPTEETVGENSCGWAGEGWLFQRLVDLSTGGAGDPTKLRCNVSSRPCVVLVAESGMDVPNARKTGTRSGRRGHRTLAHQEVAANKKGARKKLAFVALLDETGFMLQPLRHRTWAPRGQTPVHKTWDRRDRLSTIGALTVSPRRHHLNLYFRFQPRNVEGCDLVSFVRQLHRRLPGPLVLVWDRSGPHRRAASQLLREHSDWLSIDWLPSYSPKLNPVEHCWSQTKYHDLGNFRPEDTDALHKAASNSLSQQRLDQSLLKSHFKYAKLTL